MRFLGGCLLSRVVESFNDCLGAHSFVAAPLIHIAHYLLVYANLTAGLIVRRPLGEEEAKLNGSDCESSLESGCCGLRAYYIQK